MAVVNQVEKKAKLDKFSIVQFQILTHCFLSGIVLSPAELTCLSMLALDGEQELNSFCQNMHSQSVFKSSQTVRNAISKAERNNLVVKEGKSKKKIKISSEIKVQTDGNILLDYKFLFVASS
jgi:hypothetical protein